jgi:translation initiation factor IF-3
VPRERALKIAEERGYDLVEVAPNAKPPVAKLLDLGKFLYQQSKLERENRSKQKEIEVKEIGLGYKTGENDRRIRLKKAREFLEEGNKVKIVLRLFGREQIFAKEAEQDLLKVKDEIGLPVIMEQPPKKLGNRIVMVLALDKKAYERKKNETQNPQNS